MTQFQLGSISTGTLRPEDLLPRFMGALEELTGTIEERYDEDNMDELIDDLNNACPPFVYFGALEGDGADFGFWPDMDRLNEALQVNGLPHLDEPKFIDLEDDGLIVHISDHGNVTVMDIDHNVIWSTV